MFTEQSWNTKQPTCHLDMNYCASRDFCSFFLPFVATKGRFVQKTFTKWNYNYNQIDLIGHENMDMFQSSWLLECYNFFFIIILDVPMTCLGNLHTTHEVIFTFYAMQQVLGYLK
jgi:hypothetical protein